MDVALPRNTKAMRVRSLVQISREGSIVNRRLVAMHHTSSNVLFHAKMSHFQYSIQEQQRKSQKLLNIIVFRVTKILPAGHTISKCAPNKQEPAEIEGCLLPW